MAEERRDTPTLADSVMTAVCRPHETHALPPVPPNFEAEERVAALVETAESHAPTFGLVLVAGWPRTNQAELACWEHPYNCLKVAVEQCFDVLCVAPVLSHPDIVNYHLEYDLGALGFMANVTCHRRCRDLRQVLMLGNGHNF